MENYIIYSHIALMICFLLLSLVLFLLGVVMLAGYKDKKLCMKFWTVGILGIINAIITFLNRLTIYKMAAKAPLTSIEEFDRTVLSILSGLFVGGVIVVFQDYKHKYGRR